MNRRELLKLFGLSATATVLPLRWISARATSVTYLSKLHRLVGVFAYGYSKESAVGKVKVYRGDALLLDFKLNAYGGMLMWRPPFGMEPVIMRNYLGLQADAQISLVASLVDQAGIESLVIYEEA